MSSHITWHVIYHSTSHYHSDDSSESQLISNKDDDKEINHITYSICKVSRSLLLWIFSFERDQNKILFESRDIYTSFVSVLFIHFCVLSTRDCDRKYCSKILIKRHSTCRKEVEKVEFKRSMYSFYLKLLILFRFRSRLDIHKIKLRGTLHIE
jgi:hypothetical protein